MASFLRVILVIMSLMASPSLSLQLKNVQHRYGVVKQRVRASLTTPTSISAAPAVLPSPSTHSSPSPVSSFTELSPDISPLFPKTGGKVPPPPPPSSILTIPSNPSPPNPDETVSLTPEALSPLGSLPASSAMSLNYAMALSSAVFMGIFVIVLAM